MQNLPPLKLKSVYKSCMRILLIVGIVSLISIRPVFTEQTLKEIMTPPDDSADRENLRIWVPIERGSRCRLTVDILDKNDQVIRHLVDFLAGPGYYNFYWDKKDDSGVFADSGNYRYLINDCGKEKRRQIRVTYTGTGIRIEIESALGLFTQKVQRDSTNLRIEWLSETDSLITTVLDTTLIVGLHKISLPDNEREHLDNFIQQIRIDGKVVERKRSRTKEPK